MASNSGFNLPPGCFESDLPGNRPQDLLHEQAVEEAAENIAEICIEHEENCEFALVRRGCEKYQGCVERITAIGIDGTIVESFGDPSLCPYFDAAVEQQMEVIKDRNTDFGED